MKVALALGTTKTIAGPALGSRGRSLGEDPRVLRGNAGEIRGQPFVKCIIIQIR